MRNSIDWNDNTPLHYSFFKNNPKIGNMLIKSGLSDLNARNKDG